MSDAAISLSILAAVVVLFVWNRFPVELVAVAAALALFFNGVLTLDESLAGFGDPAVILIAALFVVSEGLDATGVTSWLAAPWWRSPAGTHDDSSYSPCCSAPVSPRSSG